ncbi:hypothetical protein F2P81_002645 [Scophthalmus maximus]|uniref:Uncharacterized protein n=1 Tax=Scophthalmus maximus TaxID=52904 RepID=A0A6A4TEX7_SCOMX|nr:hypothetical protein F2P81_002645 [Scophthalmus maximus]
MSAAQGLLNSVFSCSSPASKAMTKRRLRQTRSLDPAIISHCDTDTEGASGAPFSVAPAADAGASPERVAAAKPTLRTNIPRLKEPIAPSLSSPSIPLDVSPSSNFHFDYDTVKRAKRNTAGDLPFLVRGPGAAPSAGSTGALFSARRWLQRKVQPSSSHAYVVWKSEDIIRCVYFFGGVCFLYVDISSGPWETPCSWTGRIPIFARKERAFHSTPSCPYLLMCDLVPLQRKVHTNTRVDQRKGVRRLRNHYASLQGRASLLLRALHINLFFKMFEVHPTP